jgi:hypothetical protein
LPERLHSETIELGKRTVTVAEGLASDHIWTVLRAIEWIGKHATEDETLVPVLEEATRHEEPLARGSAAEWLGVVDSKGARKCLLRLLADSDADVRFHSAFALARHADPEALPHVVSALDGEKYWQTRACDVLNRYARPVVYARLQKATVQAEVGGTDLFECCMRYFRTQSLGVNLRVVFHVDEHALDWTRPQDLKRGCLIARGASVHELFVRMSEYATVRSPKVDSLAFVVEPDGTVKFVRRSSAVAHWKSWWKDRASSGNSPRGNTAAGEAAEPESR